MTFPLGRDQKSLFEWAKAIQNQLIQLKDYADGMVALMQQPVSLNQVLDYLDAVTYTIGMLEQAQTVEALPPFAATMFYNNEVDFVAEGQLVLNALNALKTTIIDALPVDESGYLLKDWLNPSTGERSVRTLPPAALSAILQATQTLSSTMV